MNKNRIYPAEKAILFGLLAASQSPPKPPDDQIRTRVKVDLNAARIAQKLLAVRFHRLDSAWVSGSPKTLAARIGWALRRLDAAGYVERMRKRTGRGGAVETWLRLKPEGRELAARLAEGAQAT